MEDFSSAGDAELILLARDGDQDAFAQLWERHAGAGRALARSYSPGFDADDLVSEAYTKILRAIRRGKGPTSAFRPYLYATIKNTAISWQRASRTDSVENFDDYIDETARDPFDAIEGSTVADAFAALPPKWRDVLWYVEVEGMAASDIAPLLGMTPNAVAALTYRAREGFRQSWIQVQLDGHPMGPEHEWVVGRMGALARGSLSRRDRRKVDAHLETCVQCRALVDEAVRLGASLRAVAVPFVLGLSSTGAATWLAGRNVPTSDVAMGADGLAVDPAPAAHSARRGAGAKLALAGGPVVAAVILSVVLTVLGGPGSYPEAVPSTPSAPTPEVAERPTPTAVPPTPTPRSAPTSEPVPDAPSRPSVVLAVPAVDPQSFAAPVTVSLLAISGTGTPGASVSALVDGTVVGGGTVDGTGRWRVTADLSRVVDGLHEFIVHTEHPAAALTAASRTFRVDRTVSVPRAIVASAAGDGAPILSGIADGDAQVRVIDEGRTIATVPVDPSGRWNTGALRGAEPGARSLRVVAVDDAGNVSESSAPVRVTFPD